MRGWFLGRASALLLRALGTTWRIRTEGPDPLVPGHAPVVAAFWHRNILMASYCYRDRGFSVAVSRSRDGELLITSRQDGMVRMLVPDSNGLTRRSP